LTILIVSCSYSTTENKTSESESSFEVKWSGALKNMMHKGDLSSKASLSDLKNIEHVYALGALENLKGEILIYDGKPFNSLVNDTVIKFDNTFEKKACLLVYASVTEWTPITIPDDVYTYEQFEIFVAKTAKENGIDTEAPFPFLVEGTPESFDWHVINWKDGDTEHSHEKHINSGLNGSIESTPVEMLGFYSNAHHAIFTHHTTNMHIHVKTTDNSLAGHVDGLTLGTGMILKIPVLSC